MGQGRLLAVFEAVATAQPVTLAGVATSTGLPTSSAHRALVTLAAAGWVRTAGVGRPRWIVSERIQSLVGGSSTRLVATARPTLEDLAASTGETAALWLGEGASVVVAASAAPVTPLRVVLADGIRTPSHWCAAGKVLLAQRSDVEVRLVAARGLTPATARTVGDAEQLLVELRRARAGGIAWARDEEADGITSVAAPIADRPVALGLVGPSDRLADAVDAAGATLLAAAAQLAADLAATDEGATLP